MTSSLTRATTAAATSSSTLSSAASTSVATSSRASSTTSTAATSSSSSSAASTSVATSAATSSSAATVASSSSSSSSRLTSAAATTATATTTAVTSSSANNVASTTLSSSSARVSTSTLSSISAAASTSATTATTAAAATTTTTNAQTSSSSGRVVTTSAQSTPTTAAVVTSTTASTNAVTTTRSSASSTSASATTSVATSRSSSTTLSTSSMFTSSSSSTTGSSSGGWDLLPGSVIGSPGSYANLGNNISKAYDTSFTTFYDAATASGSWVGLNLGSAASIKQIQYAARNGYTGRMLGGTFQASNSASFSPSSRVVTLFTIPTNARVPSGSYATQTITISGSYQFVRYLGPNGGYCNVAEIAFRGVRSATASVATTMTSSAPNSRRSLTQISNNNSTVPGFDINAYSALVATVMGVNPSMLYSIIEFVNSTAPFKVISIITSETIFNSSTLASQLIVALNDPSIQTFLTSSGFQQMAGSTMQEEVETPNPAPATEEVYTLTPGQAEPDDEDDDVDGGDTALIIGADSASPFGPLTLASLIGIVVGGAVFVIVIVVVVVIVVKKKKTHNKAIDLSIF
eukprot:TRINITY_DN1852_c0_g1_i1.p1 TRINITY_DN1852_c0_g1~~TRINITY_DN1852_c0_g1_i1.p1  ORF type:complete len:643 (+),score=180.26 TRINITY_DN1852_c0_g1_i1:199-1929(+)